MQWLAEFAPRSLKHRRICEIDNSSSSKAKSWNQSACAEGKQKLYCGGQSSAWQKKKLPATNNDVSVINATAPSHFKVAIKGPLAAAYKREQEKKKKYDELADASECDFIPFVLEAHGAFGKSAQQIVKD